jgi:hypothetical protein
MGVHLRQSRKESIDCLALVAAWRGLSTLNGAIARHCEPDMTSNILLPVPGGDPAEFPSEFLIH